MEAVTLKSVVDDHAGPGQKIFLKIDIEGGEHDLSLGIKAFPAKPNVTATISLHPTFLRRSIRTSLGRFLGFPKFIQSRKRFLRINTALVEALPGDKTVTIDGKRYTDFRWFLIKTFVSLRSPKEILIRNEGRRDGVPNHALPALIALLELDGCLAASAALLRHGLSSALAI